MFWCMIPVRETIKTFLKKEYCFPNRYIYNYIFCLASYTVLKESGYMATFCVC